MRCAALQETVTGAGHANYVRNYHILNLVKVASLFATLPVVFNMVGRVASMMASAKAH
jgi:hypothetical protein